MADNSLQPDETAELIANVRQIWEAQSRAHAATPNALEPFFEYLADDLEWTFPIGRYAGTHQGKASYEEFFRYACAYFPGGLVYHLEKIVPESPDTAAVEFNDEGQTVTGHAYQASVTIHYTVRAGKLVKYVEEFRAKNV